MQHKNVHIHLDFAELFLQMQVALPPHVVLVKMHGSFCEAECG
jgi:hypothetical protein